MADKVLRCLPPHPLEGLSISNLVSIPYISEARKDALNGAPSEVGEGFGRYAKLHVEALFWAVIVSSVHMVDGYIHRITMCLSTHLLRLMFKRTDIHGLTIRTH